MNLVQNKAFNKLRTTIHQAFDLVAPEHVVTISAKSLTEPWKTKGLSKSNQTELNYYKKTLLPNCPETDHERYKEYTNKYNILKRQTHIHIQFYNDKCIQHKNNMQIMENYKLNNM